MKSQFIITSVMSSLLCSLLSLQAQDIDKELSVLAEKLSAHVKEQSKKKVAVIDFTDLQGNPSGELGKYIAEQLTVNLVISKKDFSVLDRANLRRILAEHKLTATGLIDPENAKKLGMFAGVDALIMGTIIPKNSNISLTAKIITTDTAEIIGAARAEFKADEVVQQLVSRPAKAEEATDQAEPRSPPPPKLFGDLQARVESLKLLPGDNIYGSASLSLIITYMSDSKTWGVALHPDHYNNFNLSNSRGDEFRATEVNGIDKAFEGFGGFQGSVSDIPPRSAITISSKSSVRWTGKPGDYRPYRLQTVVIFGEEQQGRHSNLRKYNLVLDVK
jgi:TolB-like protein